MRQGEGKGVKREVGKDGVRATEQIGEKGHREGEGKGEGETQCMTHPRNL